MHKIKRYINRKLYDSTDKKYITLDGVSELIKAGEQITVTDNKTGEDLTSAIITQVLGRDTQARSGDLTSRILIQLLRKGPGTLVDYGKKYVSMWDKALTAADEEIEKRVDRLIKEKNISEFESSTLRKDIASRADDLKKWIGKKIDQRINEVLGVMNLATKDHMAELTAQVRSLTNKVEKLEKRQARKPEKADSKVANLKKEAVTDEEREGFNRTDDNEKIGLVHED
jgi:polyhydroxyalkanoate synthesis repressor PhaR